MKQRMLTTGEMKKVEENSDRQGLSFLRLMENAGSAAFAVMRKHYTLQEPVTVLCGNGNNGGDGFVVARKLYENGIRCQVILTAGEPKTAEATVMYNRANNGEIPMIDFASDPKTAYRLIGESETVVDAVYGTGFHGILPPEIADLIRFTNHLGKKIFSLDIPSGMEADNVCVPEICMDAFATIVFAAYKPAHRLAPTAFLCGEITLADIGIEESAYETVIPSVVILTEKEIQSMAKKRPENGNKGTFGRLVNICGSFGMSGAAVLSTKAALRSGAGLVTLATTERLAQALIPTLIESTMLPMKETADGGISAEDTEKLLSEIEKSQAVLIGCGMGNREDTKKLVEAVLKTEKTVVVDADGINSVKDSIPIIRDSKASVILTPHIGEFSRLTGKDIPTVQKNRYALAKAFAAENGVTLVLKDSVTLIASPDGTLAVHSNENSGLAKGGSGDTLAGIIASLCAQGYAPAQAAAVGVYLHGAAAANTASRLSKHSMLASDVIDDLAFAFKKIE